MGVSWKTEACTPSLFYKSPIRGPTQTAMQFTWLASVPTQTGGLLWAANSVRSLNCGTVAPSSGQHVGFLRNNCALRSSRSQYWVYFLFYFWNTQRGQSLYCVCERWFVQTVWWQWISTFYQWISRQLWNCKLKGEIFCGTHLNLWPVHSELRVGTRTRDRGPSGLELPLLGCRGKKIKLGFNGLAAWEPGPRDPWEWTSGSEEILLTSEGVELGGGV